MNLLSFYKQSATYWAPGAPDGFGGKSFSAPVTIKCRWTFKEDMIINDQGDEILSRGFLYSDTVIALGGYLYLGVSATADPTTIQDAFIALKKLDTPSLNNSQTLRKVFV